MLVLPHISLLPLNTHSGISGVWDCTVSYLLLKLFCDALVWIAAMQNGMHFLCISTVGLLGSCLPRSHLHLARTNIPSPALPGLPNTAAHHSRTLQLLPGAQHGEQQKQKIFCKSTGETIYLVLRMSRQDVLSSQLDWSAILAVLFQVSHLDYNQAWNQLLVNLPCLIPLLFPC